MQIGEIKPLLKKGMTNEAANYRPISLLPLIWKVIVKQIQQSNEGFSSKKWTAVY